MPTTYPKCTPTEMLGLLVLLNEHKGVEDLARLASDLDLEIDEILPSVDFAEALQLMKVSDGRASLTDLGKKLLAKSIRERKTILREQLRKTTLFKALLRALESSPEHRLTEEEMNRLIEFTTAPADELVQNIINWGRYAELFRYDPDQRLLLLPRSRLASRTSGRPPASPGVGTSPGSAAMPESVASDRGGNGLHTAAVAGG
ncbi:MAG: AAA-associated domain-containing protein [Thermoplasmata archaeon]|nr:AAA-associated domain-containing protein [Thermoplasmata archaeon]